MLIRFSVENFRSFRERVYLSFVPAESEERHADRVVPAKTPGGFPLLKLAVLYGANASGKSNLVHAITTAQQMILKSAEAGAQLPMQPFKLDAEWRGKPSRFEFEIRVGERQYAYGFVATAERVVEEWLYEVGKESETCVFERKERFTFPGIAFGSDEERQFLEFTAKGTLANRLFLTECRERDVAKNVSSAAPLFAVIDWFASRLTVLFPEMEYVPLYPRLAEDDTFRTDLGSILRAADTGIESVEMKDVPLGDGLLPEDARKHLLSNLPPDRMVVVHLPGEKRYLVSRDEQGELRARRLVFRHRSGDPEAVFEFGEESDGTRRFMDLIPVLLQLVREEKCIVVDEFDRSLHPELARSFLTSFQRDSGSRESQLVVTTHETTLMDHDFLRRDEIWLVDKGADQVSQLTSLLDYKERPQGANLRRDYLNGRYGGVPILRDFSLLGQHDAKGP